MIKLCIKIALIALAGIFSVWPGVCPAVELSVVEYKLLEQINQNRETELIVNSKLTQVAQSRAEQFYEDEFGSGSQENQAVTIQDAGYFAIRTGLSNGLILFSNYISSDNAAGLLYESLVREAEYDGEDSNLFSEKILEAGLCVYETQVAISGMRFNVYIGSLAWAQPVIAENSDAAIIKAQVENLIDQQRSLLSQGPLFQTDMSEESDVIQVACILNGEDANAYSEQIFSLLQENERLFESRINAMDLAVDICLVQADTGYKLEGRATIRLAETDITENWIKGLVYSDTNSNGIYDPGEGVANIPMVVYDAGIHSKTGMAGKILEAVSTAGKGYQLVLFPRGSGTMIYEANQSNFEFNMININEIY